MSRNNRALFVLSCHCEYIVFQLSAVNNCIEDWRIAISGPMLVQIIAELVICAIHPPPCSLYFNWTTVTYKNV